MTQPKYAKGDTMKLTGAIDGDGKPFELEVKILSVSSPEPNPTYDVYGKHLTIEEAKALAADMADFLRKNCSEFCTPPEPKTKEVWLTWLEDEDGSVFACNFSQRNAEICADYNQQEYGRKIRTRAFKVTIPRDE